MSVEPLWEDVSIDLTGIDWLIVGGESGVNPKPFDPAWARKLQADCEAHGVAFFVKQLGERPVANGEELSFRHRHGGDWDEWPQDLHVRQFPTVFKEIAERREAGHGEKPEDFLPITSEEEEEFRRLDEHARKGMTSFVEAGTSLNRIRQNGLWRGQYATWSMYCREALGLSKTYANRIIGSRLKNN